MSINDARSSKITLGRNEWDATGTVANRYPLSGVEGDLEGIPSAVIPDMFKYCTTIQPCRVLHLERQQESPGFTPVEQISEWITDSSGDARKSEPQNEKGDGRTPPMESKIVTFDRTHEFASTSHAAPAFTSRLDMPVGLSRQQTGLPHSRNTPYRVSPIFALAPLAVFSMSQSNIFNFSNIMLYHSGSEATGITDSYLEPAYRFDNFEGGFEDFLLPSPFQGSHIPEQDINSIPQPLGVTDYLQEGPLGLSNAAWSDLSQSAAHATPFPGPYPYCRSEPQQEQGNGKVAPKRVPRAGNRSAKRGEKPFVRKVRIDRVTGKVVYQGMR
uniref:Uncharacterized protein n=1 Tax=Psilocybe cubensis TaxID=181762 RepID=A0A8H7Y1G8_PSICU